MALEGIGSVDFLDIGGETVGGDLRGETDVGMLNEFAEGAEDGTPPRSSDAPPSVVGLGTEPKLGKLAKPPW